MSMQEEVELLKNIPLFAKIDPSKLKLLAFASARLTYAVDDILFDQGDTGDAAYIIIGGEAEVLVATPGGPLVVATLKQNEIVGEIAILCNVPRTATVRAKTQLTALRVTKDLFFSLVVEFPEIAVEIMRELGHRRDRTTKQLQEAVAQGQG